MSADVRASETYSDNVALQRNAQARADWITEITPGVQLVARRPRANAFVRLEWQTFNYLRRPEDNRQALRLNGNSHWEIVDQIFFLDSTASISRQNTSALGAQGSSYNTNSNQSEVRTYSLSPYARWKFAQDGTGLVRYQTTYSDSSQGPVSNYTMHTLSADLANGRAWGRLGWGLNASQTRSDGGGTRPANSSQLQGSLTYALSQTLSTQFSTGRERNDYAAGQTQSAHTWGLGVKWVPDTRTSLSVQGSRNFFGNGYVLQAQHRTRRFLYDVSAQRAVSNTSQLLTANGVAYSPAYQAKYNQLKQQYSQVYSGQTLELFVLALLQAAIQSGEIPPPQFGAEQFSTAFSLQRSLRMAVTFTGQRNTILASLTRSTRESNSEINGVLPSGDLVTYTRVREWQAHSAWTSRLSPLTSLTTTATYSQARGEGGVSTDRRNTRQFQASLDHRLGPDSTGGVMLRHARSSGLAQYTENAVVARFGHRF